MIRIFTNYTDYDKAEPLIKVGKKVIWLFQGYSKQEIFTMIMFGNGKKTIRLDENTSGKRW